MRILKKQIFGHRNERKKYSKTKCHIIIGMVILAWFIETESVLVTKIQIKSRL